MIKNIKDSEPNPATIRLLEQLLKEAKAGEIRSLIYFCGFDDDGMAHGWSLDNRNTRRRILSEITLLQHDFIVNIEMHECDSVLSRQFDY